jgi:general secretion pathway protein I
LKRFSLKNSIKKNIGMSLIEVLVAMSILAITGLALGGAINAAFNANRDMREKTIAHWVAMNRSAEIQLKTKWPDIGTKRSEIEMVGRTWHVETVTKKSQQPKVREVTIKVKEDPTKEYALSVITLFMGENR